MKATLEYYFTKGKHIVFDKYWINKLGIITHKKTKRIPTYNKIGNYNRVTIYDNDGKSHTIYVARAIASTFIGSPPSLSHTADHIDHSRPDYDALENIRWLDKSGQAKNRSMPDTRKSAFIVVNNGIEKTVKEWVEYLSNDINHMKRKYTIGIIQGYVMRKQHGFSYKYYPDLDGEIWKTIVDSNNSQGYWEISNMNRVKFITTNASNVLWGERLGLNNGMYPFVGINGKQCLCHILSFQAFYPNEWEARNSADVVMHIDDDKNDFRPQNLKLGTQTENNLSARDNGKYNSAITARMICFSYIDNIFEKEHESQSSAVNYLRNNGYPKAITSNISFALSQYKNGTIITKYDRTWKTEKYN
jgi:hypothetical protein